MVALASIFTLLNWNSFTGPFERDEGEYAYAAWLLSSGLPPYLHSFLQKPPMIVYTYYLASFLDPNAVWPPRILAAASILGAGSLLWLAADRIHGRGAAWAAVWIFFPTIVFPSLVPFAANTEKFMILPLLGGIAVYACASRSRSPWPRFVMGTLAALSLLYKPLSLPVIVFVVVVWMIDTWRGHPAVGQQLRDFASLVFGAGVATTAVVAYFVRKGAFWALWESAIFYNRYYAEEIRAVAPTAPMTLLRSFAEAGWVLFVLLGWLVVVRPPKWWLSLGLVVTAFISASRDFSGHYYIMVVPMLALACGASLQTVAERVDMAISKNWPAVASSPPRASRRRRQRDAVGKWRTGLVPARYLCARSTVVSTVLIAIVTATLLATTVPQWFLSPDELIRRAYWGNPFPESRLVAAKVAAMTSPEDKVFIAGSEPQILFYAKRKSPTRFVTMYPLMLPTPVAEAYQTEVIRDLKRDLPKIIVLSKVGTSWLVQPDTPGVFLSALEGLLGSGAYIAAGAYVRTADGGRWEELVTAERLQTASLVVYRRDEGILSPGS